MISWLIDSVVNEPVGMDLFNRYSLHHSKTTPLGLFIGCRGLLLYIRIAHSSRYSDISLVNKKVHEEAPQQSNK